MPAVSFLLFILILFNMSEIKAQTEEWKKIKDVDGISVYTTSKDNSELKTVKITAEAKSSLSALVSLIKDASAQKKWVFLNKDCRILKVCNMGEWIYYGQSEAPWPVLDRDIVSRVRMIQVPDTKEVIITAQTEKGLYPKQKNFVRIPYGYSQWRFMPEKNGNVKISLIVKVNLGGNIPLWLMRLVATRGPYLSMKHFLKELKKEKYQNISIPEISEP